MLLDGVERRTALAELLLRREPWDALMVVFGESDTVAHHFWRFHDRASPRYAPRPHADAIRRVYRALDDAIGRLVAAAGDASVAVVSDHGSGGAGDVVVHLNRYLARAAGCSRFRRAAVERRAGRCAASRVRAVPLGSRGALLRRAAGGGRAARRRRALRRHRLGGTARVLGGARLPPRASGSTARVASPTGTVAAGGLRARA